MEWEHKNFLERTMRKFLFKPKNKKGVAGLEVLLSVVVMLFVIGFLVMIFAMMGGELGSTDQLMASEGPLSITNETVTFSNGTAGVTLTTCETATNGVATILFVTNNTVTTVGETVSANNYTVSRCVMRPTGAGPYNGTSVNVSYTYVYSGIGFTTINATSTELAGVTDWFGIIIVINAMVVLILLTVIIISAIRGTGLVGLGGSDKPPRETA